MLFNLVCGVNYSMGIASGSFDGIDSSRVLTVNKTIDPLALVIKTTVGSSSELIVYYREKPTDSFSGRERAGILQAAGRIQHKAAADGA